MFLEKILSSRKIGILGFGKEGEEFQKFLKLNNFNGKVEIFDQNIKNSQEGVSDFSNLGDSEYFFKSPGISRRKFPGIQKKFKEGKIFSGTEIFLNFLNENRDIFPNYKTIGITGTKGKSTISSLINHILCDKFGENNIELLGNIGVPALNFINSNIGNTNNNLNKIFILELSSYQVEDLNPEQKLDFGLLVNIFPDHLDYHDGFENYKKAKNKILEISEKKFLGTEKKFLDQENFLDFKKIKLKGEHNKNNILFVSNFLKENFGFSDIEIKKSIEKFQPLKHRMEEFRHLNRLWINDAISTTPDSTIQCLKTYKNRINGVILGGQDRGYNFENLVKTLSELPNLKAIAIFENCPKILDSIEKIFLEKNIKLPKTFISNNLEKITKFLFEYSEKQGVITLSTASPSYGYFKNFEEQGNIFLENIKKI